MTTPDHRTANRNPPSPQPHGMPINSGGVVTAEHILIIVDEFTAAMGPGVYLVRPWVCAAVAAAARGRIAGISTHRHHTDMYDAVKTTITRLKPLNKNNDALADVVIDVMTLRH